MSELDITLGARSEETGRFNFVRGADGDVSFDETGAHEVMTSVVEVKESWWANRNHGSEIRKIRSVTSRTPSQVEAMALDALADSERRSIVSELAVRATTQRAGQTVGRLSLRMAWTTAKGEQQEETVEV